MQNVQVAERGPTSFKITWSPPAGNGGEPLTGYGLLIWHKDTPHPPYDQAASIGVTDNHTFTGLQPGNTYNFRIHACNGTDSCGWWTAILEATTTAATPAPGVPTAPHSILSDQVGANSFRVRWSPHAETGGSALTRFGILVRQSGSSWDESRTVWVNANPPHRYSVTGRDPGTTYVIKIKSCNGSNDQTSCSAWSSDHRVTTVVVEVNTGTRLVQATPVDGECPYTEPGQTTWGPPQNLDVTPLEGREITLCWTPVMNAESYTVSATHNPTDQSPTFSEVKGTLTDTKMVIHLDNIYKSPSDTGLGQNKAYGFKVTAKQMGSTTTAESSIIMIIDTPITKATTQGQASDVLNIEWDSIRDIVGSSYSGGQYIIRYRKSHPLGDISKSPRMKGYFDTPETPEEGVSSGLTIGSLTNNAVYGIQLVFWHPGPSNAAADDTWVFAARHAYAWVGLKAPPHSTRVAGVPVEDRIDGKSFQYKICRSTFRQDGRVGSWESLIMDAFDTWQDAVSTDLITIESIAHNDDPCTDYNRVASEIYMRHRQSMTDAAFSGFSEEDRISYIEDLLITSDQEQVGPLGVPGIAPQIDALKAADRVDNEVKMYYDVEGVQGYLARQGVFKEIASSVGYVTECWYRRTGKKTVTGRDELDPEPARNVLMCTIHSPGGDQKSSDIFIRRSKFQSDLLLSPESNSMFNMCRNSSDNKNSAFQSLVHEIGHALGIGGGPNGHSLTGVGVVGETHHVSSVVNRRKEPDCAPHPLDIMALYALYQRRL